MLLKLREVVDLGGLEGEIYLPSAVARRIVASDMVVGVFGEVFGNFWNWRKFLEVEN